MNKTKFTPGPWTCLGPSFGDPLPRYTTEIETGWEYEGAENRQICEMPFHHHDEENEANAHLIAAAPCLYEALEDLLYQAERQDSEPNFSFDQAKAALAKGLGGSMIGCDMCGKRVESQFNLVQLLKVYSTHSIKDICKDCEKDVNKHLWKVRELYEPLVCRSLKRYMRYRRMDINRASIARGEG